MKKKKQTRTTRKAPVNPPDGLLAAALGAQADGVLIAERGTSAQGLKVLFVNDSFCAITERERAELVGRPHGFLHADKGDVARISRWQRTAKPGRPCVGEGYLLRKDGSTIYATWTFGVIACPKGRETHIVATYRDTTERRRLQEALVHAQRLDAVGRLAGGVAHDFNNLLSVINGYCEMLAAQVGDRPQALREVNEIHKAGLRASTLTRQLLAFGRRQPMDARVMNLNRLVQDNAEIIERLLGSAGRLEIELGPRVGNVRADATQFQQVLLNLALNARDALRDHGCITITTSTREIKPGQNRRVTDVPPGRYACLSVSDNGTGMDADTQKQLFEPFFTTKPEGTGLGLALVYGVVQQSGGYISVRSALLAGSTFEILLPEVNAPVDDPQIAAPIAPLPVTRGHETLLLIEHDEVVRKMIAGMLTADGYRVLAAKTPEEGLLLARANERPVQLLISPFSDSGQVLARSLHAMLPELRVLGTSNHEEVRPLPWLDKKRQSSLAKPYALSELLRRARALLDS